MSTHMQDADVISFQCESGEEDRIADFDLKLMQIESEYMEIPEQHYKAWSLAFWANITSP